MCVFIPLLSLLMTLLSLSMVFSSQLLSFNRVKTLLGERI